MNYQEALLKCQKYHQEHVLTYYDTLSIEEQNKLLNQIHLLDFSIIQKSKEEIKRGIITPLKVMKKEEINREKYKKIGLDAINRGEVAAVILAGGMGTRLGSNDPKGMYNIGINKHVFIFERLIENILEVVNLSSYIHLFIMTSDKNNDKTIQFFEEHHYFNYKKEYIHFFKQEMAPCIDYDKKIYLENKYTIASSPNGNGGFMKSMKNADLLDLVNDNNIQWLNVVSVDNVLQRIADPVFIGATIDGNYCSASKVVKKADINEKVGVMCLEDAKPSIVEYYELTNEMLNEQDDNHQLAYNFGVILNYLFKVDELNKIIDKKLPLHIVEKKIPYMNDKMELIFPNNPNGYKYETLILDMIHNMPSCLPFEVERNIEFAPIKNKVGVDSVETARKLCQLNHIEL